MKYYFYLSLLLLSISTSCKQSYYLTEISESSSSLDTSYNLLDTSLANLILPYQNKLDHKMNEIVGKTAQELNKQKPESTLGNLLADATLEMSLKYFETKPDIAIINYGGIRVPNLAKGDITLGQVYELMPFDNYVVMLKIDGNTLQEVFDLMAAQGGWPIAGARYTISEGKAKEIFINNSAIKTDYIYSIVLSDYLANGGDNMQMLKKFPQENENILLRDLFISYFKLTLANETLLNSKLDKRVSYE